ncbi:hypothetical protein [Frigidibacter sp. MR17.24]|uniref:hypothetical protein n=1 Tax=Frigidibacter sp. MR17.24 TaxID=3127345 RepID=UPI003012FDFC
MAFSNTAQAGTTAAHNDGFMAALRRGFVSYMERKSRSQEIARLNAMTDDELSQMGVTRDRIAHYVFRDLFYV